MIRSKTIHSSNNNNSQCGGYGVWGDSGVGSLIPACIVQVGLDKKQYINAEKYLL